MGKRSRAKPAAKVRAINKVIKDNVFNKIIKFLNIIDFKTKPKKPIRTKNIKISSKYIRASNQTLDILGCKLGCKYCSSFCLTCKRDLLFTKSSSSPNGIKIVLRIFVILCLITHVTHIRNETQNL